MCLLITLTPLPGVGLTVTVPKCHSGVMATRCQEP